MSGAEAVLGIVAGKLHRICQAVKDAPKDLSELAFALDTIPIALQQLEQQRQQTEYDGTLLHRCVMQCRDSVIEMQGMVDKIETRLCRHIKLCGQLCATLNDPEIRVLLDKLDRARGSLDLAYLMFLNDRQGQYYDAEAKAHLEYKSTLRNSIDQLASRDRYIPQDVTSYQQPPKETSKRNFAKIQPYAEGKRQTVFRARVYLPASISPVTRYAAAIRSQCGWILHFQAYHTIPPNSSIVRVCINGDLRKVQYAFEAGEASHLDVVALQRRLELIGGT